MRNTLKKEKGITLISLAVTIVVMLILASISINYSLDSIDHSKFMAMYSEIQVLQEKVNLYYSEGKVILSTNLTADHKVILQNKGVSSSEYDNYYYFTKDVLRQTFDMDSIEGEYLISIKNRDVIGLTTIKNDGKEYVNYRYEDLSEGFNVEYSGTDGSASGTKLSTLAKIGEYVNYDPTDVSTENEGKTSYTSYAGSTTSHGNGYGEQKFSASAYDGKWQILNIDDEGTITLISDAIYRDNEDSTGMLEAADANGLYLQNGIGYLWAEEELNRISAIYGYGNGADTSKKIEYYYGGPNDQDGSITAGTVEAQQGRKTTLKVDGSTEILTSGARAITVADINKICGKTYGINYSSDTVEKTSNNAKYYPTLSGTSSTGQSVAQSSPSGSYYYTYYSYTISSTNSDSTAASNQNNMLKIGVNYWLGSRCVFTDSDYAFFYVRTMSSSGIVNSNSTCYCNVGTWNSYSVARAVRAVVTLRTDVKTSDTEYPGDSVGWNLADSIL